MNKLKFDGQVTDLFAEDFKYLQDNLESEVGKGFRQMASDILVTSIIKGFNPSIITSTGILVSHGLFSNSLGAIVTPAGMVFETSTAFAVVTPTAPYTNTETRYICAKYSQVDGTYNKKTGLVEEGVARAIDYANYSLVYDREIDKCEIMIYTAAEYAVLDNSINAVLGSIQLTDLGKLYNLDLSLRSGILLNIPDGSIAADKLDSASLIPQIQIQNTSTGTSGIIDDRYPLTDNTVDLKDDLNKIRSAIRLIKDTAKWDDNLTGITSSDPDINRLNKIGVLQGNAYNDLTTTLNVSADALEVQSGRAVANGIIKSNYFLTSVGIEVGDNIHTTSTGEYHLLTSSGLRLDNYPVNSDSINYPVRVLWYNPVSFEWQYLTINTQYTISLSDYAIGRIVFIGIGGGDQIIVDYYHGTKRIDVLVVDTADTSLLTGLKIVKGNPLVNPTPYPLPPDLTDSMVPLYFMNKEPFTSTINPTDIFDVRQYVPDIRSIQEFDYTDIPDQNITRQWMHNKFTYLYPAAGSSAAGYHTTINGYEVINHLYGLIPYEPRLEINSQEDDEVWLQLILQNSEPIQLQFTLDGVTSTIVIPTYGATVSTPVLVPIYKGLTEGWHQISFKCLNASISLPVFYIYKVIIGKLDNAYTNRFGTSTGTVDVFGKLKMWGGWTIEYSLSGTGSGGGGPFSMTNSIDFSVAGVKKMRLAANGNLYIIGTIHEGLTSIT